ncbi:MAG: hypothetical protein LBR29_01635 [Methylobacteriaceae bacterium]|jgi:hypothetical protein|nr:hypothetical protein [Methylobacteriaceae bacterium]
MIAKVRFQSVTNRETWLERMEVLDAETGRPMDYSTAAFRVFVTSEGEAPAGLSAPGDGVVTGTAEGIVEWLFPESAMRTLEPGHYAVGVVYEQDGRFVQLLTGILPVEDGVVA